MLYSSSFFKFFPPPRFLEMPAVGLDISDEAVRFAGLKRGHGGFVLGTHGEESIPPGIVVQGEIRKPEELSDILARLGKEYQFSFVNFALPEQQGYSLKVKIPRVRPKDIYESLELQLDQYVPIAPQETVFDYDLVRCGVRQEDTTLDIGLSAMSLDVVQSYMKIFENTDLTPLSMEFEAHSIARAVVKGGDCGTYILVEIGSTRTGFSVYSKGIITFTSTINIGGSLLTESIARTLGISLEKAQEAKEAQGLLGGKEDPVYQAIMARLSVLKDEIATHCEYARSHDNVIDKGTSVDGIILCGGEAHIPGLVEYVSGALTMEVFIANPWININPLTHYVPEISGNHALRYATALGLALGFQS